MTKDSVFFTIHSKQPSDSRRFYFQSNKEDSNNLLNYMVDPHSFDDIGNKSLGFVNVHDNEIFDQKLGLVSFKDLAKVNKDSMIFTGLVSFDEELSKKDVFGFYWQDISNIIFNTIISGMDWDVNNWEMQSNFHFNTNNKHIQFRLYQNDKTKPEELFKNYWIKKDIVNLVKDKILKFVKDKTKDNVLHYTHYLKGEAIQSDNQRIKENKELINDFLELLNLKEIKSHSSKVKVSRIADLYYSRQWFKDWIKIYLRPLKLTSQEVSALEAIIKNNIISEIYLFAQNNKKLKVFDFVAKKDPNDKSQKQKFKNFDKINQQVTFEKIATYKPKTVNLIYKEPMSRWIDLLFSRQQYSLPELESALNNYIASIRPNAKKLFKFEKPTQQMSKTSNYVDFFIKVWNEYQRTKSKDALLKLAKALAYNTGKINYLKQYSKYNNLSDAQLSELAAILIKNYIKWIPLNLKNENINLKTQKDVDSFLKLNILNKPALSHSLNDFYIKNKRFDLIDEQPFWKQEIFNIEKIKDLPNNKYLYSTYDKTILDEYIRRDISYLFKNNTTYYKNLLSQINKFSPNVSKETTEWVNMSDTYKITADDNISLSLKEYLDSETGKQLLEWVKKNPNKSAQEIFKTFTLDIEKINHVIKKYLKDNDFNSDFELKLKLK